jgi:hypothetical protein
VIHSGAALLLAADICAAQIEIAGSAACAACHSEIYNNYRGTPMANSSGRVGAGRYREKFDRGEFRHARSGVHYRVYREGGDTVFDFDFQNGETRISGSRRLAYFVGSGAVGRSYLLSIDNYLYQAPVAYYSIDARWRLSPGYEDRDHLYLTRPVGVTCLQCHASRLQPSPQSLNGFGPVPFLEGGISCETCHGPGGEHIRKFRSGPAADGDRIVNPGKLSPERRDSICAQCHLTGVARIGSAGRDRSSFVPGDRLSDHLSVFVWSDTSAEMTVTSHFEKLAQSRCKTAAGDRLWCGSCHDPHTLAPETQRRRFFDSKCLACHTSDSCTAPAPVRAQEGNSCTSCHMPKSPVSDVTHAVYTDHSIARNIVAAVHKVTAVHQPGSPARSLTLFGGGTPSDRDLGLAYALVAERERNSIYEARALDLLEAAVGQRRQDVPAMVQLAHLYGSRGQEEQATRLYETAVASDPEQVVAANNLATYRMRRGRIHDAITLWSQVVSRSPGFEAARMNLAVAQSGAGDTKSAEETVRKGLELNPGSTALRKLLREVQAVAR